MFSWLCQPLDGQAANRGGFRQRLARPVPVVRHPSNAALGHLLDWGDGWASAQHVLKHMNWLVSDGETTHPMNLRIAAVGAGSRSAGVAAHALMQLVRNCGFEDLLQEVAAPGVVSHVTLPSRLLGRIAQHYPFKFLQIMGGDPDRLDQFGQNLRLDPGFASHVRGHPVLRNFTVRLGR